MYCRNKIIILLFFVCCGFFSTAQTSDSAYQKGVQQQSDYMQQPVTRSSFDKKEWNDLKKRLESEYLTNLEFDYKMGFVYNADWCAAFSGVARTRHQSI